MFSFFKKSYGALKEALTKTRSQLSSRLKALVGKPWDEQTFEELEEILFEADLGTRCTLSFVDYLKGKLRLHPTNDLEHILSVLKEHAYSLFDAVPTKVASDHKPHVLLIVGVNGSGKTTSIAKLAHRFKAEGRSVLLAAGDTFRAAAIEQLATWAERLGVDLIKSTPGADPAAVAFDALTAAKARGIDIVLVDTAGRLQSKTDLMKELEKVRRTMKKVLPEAPHETLLVLDATTGQNALDQAQAFHAATPLDGIVLAKLDGSAKGGIVLSITQEVKVPVLWVGTGEKQADLAPFDAKSYVDSLFSVD
jgi:fused signal recognition particle receptor